jgi:hypothetical protein
MTAIKVAGMDYFNSILSSSLTIDADDIRQTLDSGVIAAFYERSNLNQHYKPQKSSKYTA